MDIDKERKKKIYDEMHYRWSIAGNILGDPKRDYDISK
jgi:hypothetical protein